MLLQFSRCLDKQTTKLLLIDFEDGTPLRVLIDPNWKQKMTLKDQHYLTDLTEEWKSLKAAQIPSLLDELLRQSAGPLIVVDQGHVSEADCQRMLDGFPKEAATRQSRN